MSYGCPYFAFSDFRHNIFIDDSRCIGCKACIGACPRGVISFDVGKLVAFAKHVDRCVSCFECMSVCPIGVIGVAEGKADDSD